MTALPAMAALLIATALPGSAEGAPPAVSTATAGVSLGVEDLDGLESAASPPGPTAASPESQETVVDEIDVVGQRVAEASRPDTQLRLTGRQLVERGVTNLAQALDLVSDTNLHAAGRGGFQTDIRGARKGGVLILLDGIPIADPYLGNFDVTSIPATDIAEIRVSLTPASPLDGPGGNGGVIEVLTRSATGPRNVRAGVQVSDAPGAVASATGRAPVADGLGVRVSAQGTYDNRNFTFVSGPTPGNGREDASGGTAGLRVERNFEHGRLSADLGGGRRGFVAAPASQYDDATMGSTTLDVLYVPRQDIFRAVVAGETHQGALTFSGRAYSLYLDQNDQHFRDLARTNLWFEDHIRAQRSGGALQLDALPIETLRLSAVTHFLIEGGHDDSHFVQNGVDALPSSAGGVAPVLEPALGASWAATRWFALDAAAGVAVPVGLGASAWPEGKITATFTATRALEVRLTGSRKGRLPSIKDRFDNLTGNQAVNPEMGTAAEGQVIIKPRRWLSVDLTSFYRLVEGLIRIGSITGANGVPALASTNLGDAAFYGFEARVDAALIRRLSLGAAYAFAHQAFVGSVPRGMPAGPPLDFFPQHRGEVSATFRPRENLGLWARARYIGDRTDKGATLAGYLQTDAAAWAQVDSLRVTLRVENALDTSYEIHSGVPGFGRTAFLGLEGAFD